MLIILLLRLSDPKGKLEVLNNIQITLGIGPSNYSLCTDILSGHLNKDVTFSKGICPNSYRSSMDRLMNTASQAWCKLVIPTLWEAEARRL